MEESDPQSGAQHCQDCCLKITEGHREGRAIDRIKVGIVGLGAIAQEYHIPVLSRFSDVEIEAIVDINANRRMAVARKWRTPKTYGNDIEMYQNCNLNGVFICTPNFLHSQMVTNALEHGVHVFCEKPFGTSSDEAYELGRIAKDKGLVLTVGYNRRLEKSYAEASQILNSMRLGKIVQLHGSFFLRGPYAGYVPRSDWFFEEKSGGALYDLGSHLFDIVTYLLSEKAVEVSAKSMNVLRLKVFDNVGGWFRTVSGALCTFNLGWQAASDFRGPVISIHGTGGTLLISSTDIHETYGSHGPIDELASRIRSAWKTAWQSVKDYRNPISETYVKEDRFFVDSIRGKGEPAVAADDAIHVLEVLESIKESVLRGTPCLVKHHPSTLPS